MRKVLTLLAGAKAARGSTSTVWNLAEVLCPVDPPAGATLADETAGLKALLAAQTPAEPVCARDERTNGASPRGFNQRAISKQSTDVESAGLATRADSDHHDVTFGDRAGAVDQRD